MTPLDCVDGFSDNSHSQLGLYLINNGAVSCSFLKEKAALCLQSWWKNLRGKMLASILAVFL